MDKHPKMVSIPGEQEIESPLYMGGVLEAALYIDFWDNPVESVDKFCRFARRLSTIAVDKCALRLRQMEEGETPPPHIYGRNALLGVFIHISTVPTNTTNPYKLNN